jgi:hypothetical protein
MSPFSALPEPHPYANGCRGRCVRRLSDGLLCGATEAALIHFDPLPRRKVTVIEGESDEDPDFDRWLAETNEALADSIPDTMSPAQFRDQLTRIPLSELYTALPDYLAQAEPYDVQAGLARFNAWLDEQQGTR